MTLQYIRTPNLKLNVLDIYSLALEERNIVLFFYLRLPRLKPPNHRFSTPSRLDYLR